MFLAAPARGAASAQQVWASSEQLPEGAAAAEAAAAAVKPRTTRHPKQDIKIVKIMKRE